MDNNKLIIKPKPVKGDDGYRTFSVRLREELVDRLDDRQKPSKLSCVAKLF